MYPRFSETFILSEILAHEAAGEADGADLEIFSLRWPADGRFHAALAEVRAPVTYLESGPWKASGVWTSLAEAAEELPDVWRWMDELVRIEVGDALQAVELARLVRQRDIAHLHAHFGSVATTVARLAAGLAGVPYSFTAHAKDIFHADVDPDDLRRKLTDAAAVVTVSDFNLAFLRTAYPGAAERVARVYNGLDLARFPYRSPADRPPVIAAVGRLVEKKGFGDLVAASAILAARGVDFHCRILGGGQLADTLAAQIAELGVGDRVELVGARPQDEVHRLVQGAAALAAPCVVDSDGNRDGLPTVLLEAMALGTPCVATPVTGIPEVVRDGQTGLEVPQHAPEALADALERLLVDARLRVGIAQRARSLVEEEFDIQRQAQRMRAHVLTGQRPRRVPALAGVV
jgi:glycosyltransferase involved in cell wall biosynthesis